MTKPYKPRNRPEPLATITYAELEPRVQAGEHFCQRCASFLGRDALRCEPCGGVASLALLIAVRQGLVRVVYPS
jgi:hypothetical protein